MKPDTHQQQQTSDLLSELNSLFSIVLKQSDEKRLVQPLLNSLCTLSPNFFQYNNDWSQCLQLAALSDLPLDELTYTFELISKNEIEHDVSGCIKSFLSRKLNQQDFSDFLRFLRQMQDYKHIDWAFLLKKLKTTSGSSLPYMELGNIPQYYKTKDSVNALCRYLLAYPEYATSMTHGQLDSKQWLCQEVEKVWGKKFGNLFILAGWTGSLAQMFFDQDFQFDSVRSIDMDEKACKASEILNQLQVQNNWKFKSCHININSLEYPATLNLRKNNGEIQAVVEMPELIINTSCEHMDGDTWWQKIPPGTKVVLQSNNGFHINEHVNCSKSLDEFISKMKLSQLHFAGERAMPEFHRYMIIGEK